MNHTRIEWVKNPDNKTQGFTLNDKTGCLNGCPYCYARKLANGRLKQRYLANYKLATGSFQSPQGRPIEPYKDPFYPRWWPRRLQEPYKIKKPVGIFLDDMSDWMGDYWPEDWTLLELQMMEDNPQHRIYTLTKQPQNLIKFSPFPKNCWVGVTATGYWAYVDACNYLSQVEASVKFLSIEPLLSWDKEASYFFQSGGISWVIIGACTGTLPEMVSLCDKYPELAIMRWGTKLTAQPRIEWVEEIVKACDKAGVKMFQKDNLKPLLGDKLRQELPK